MVRLFAIGVGGIAIFLLLILASFILGMRSKYPPVLNAVRRMNRATWNPRAMQTAGQPGASASVVRHIGRVSGAEYETPIGPAMTENGFVVALPYGTSPDWFKNLIAAGSATIVHEGNEYQVDRPELVTAEVGNSYFPEQTQRSHRLFGVDDFLLLRHASAD